MEYAWKGSLAPEAMRRAIAGDLGSLMEAFAWKGTPEGYEYWCDQAIGAAPLDTARLQAMLDEYEGQQADLMEKIVAISPSAETIEAFEMTERFRREAAAAVDEITGVQAVERMRETYSRPSPYARIIRESQRASAFPPDAKTAGRILTSDQAIAARQREEETKARALEALQNAHPMMISQLPPTSIEVYGKKFEFGETLISSHDDNGWGTIVRTASGRSWRITPQLEVTRITAPAAVAGPYPVQPADPFDIKHGVTTTGIKPGGAVTVDMGAGRITPTAIPPGAVVSFAHYPEPKPLSDADKAVHRAIGRTNYSDPLRFGAGQHVRKE